MSRKFMRKFIVLAMFLFVVAFLIAACQQEQPRIYKVGILQFIDLLVEVEEGFKTGMTDHGYIEGENVVYVYRNAHGNADDLERLGKELVDEQVDLIVSISTPASVAAMRASEDVGTPIVFILVSDPVRAGLVASLKQPGGHITGIRDGGIATTGKRLEFLSMMVPDIEKVLSVYSYEESLMPAMQELREAAAKLDLTLVEKQVRTTEEAAAVFAAIQPGEVDAIFAPSDGVVLNALEEIKALAMRDGLPYILPGRPSETLAFHGENVYQSGWQAASLADKIVRGSDPATLPVELSKEFVLTVNLRVAEAMGLTLSEEILIVADEVIK